ncbi:MAG: ECF-type sigma factor [Pseudomonadota bacterium]
MPIHSADEITLLLQEEHLSSDALQARLTELIYDDLKRIAASKLAMESQNQTLTVTSLVHEAYLRLSNLHSISWEDRRHYFGSVAEVMRRILIDRARYHGRQRRSAEKHAIPLEEGLYVDEIKPVELIALDDALQDLEEKSPELSQVVKLRYFAGLAMREVAELEGISERTARRRWQKARGWLLQEIYH